eukprot:TRINITY_DN21731_c0_g1_i4.p5 TRINITY_DN21731_c0_g1~~TRINITY_DN21731_c0_g1_i4.p5  ORF type:complete len:102 (+),score=26.84 TRINITY_DN21731_c0_g1_i4:3-308(+)
MHLSSEHTVQCISGFYMLCIVDMTFVSVCYVVKVCVCFFFFFSSRRRHTRCREVSWARRCVQETGSGHSTSLSCVPSYIAPFGGFDLFSFTISSSFLLSCS